jgi:hypothetical protein
MSAAFDRWIEGRRWEVRWNGSATFQLHVDGGEAVDIATRYGDENGGPCSIVQAAKIARDWLDEIAQPDRQWAEDL